MAGLMKDPREMGMWEAAKMAWYKKKGLLDHFNRQQGRQQAMGLVGKKQTPYELDESQKFDSTDSAYQALQRGLPSTNEGLTPEQNQQILAQNQASLANPGLMNKGTGLLGGEINPSEFYGGLMSTQGYEGMGAQGMQNLMNRAPQQQKPTSIMQNLIAAGYGKDTPEYQQAMKDYLMKAGTTINMGKTGNAVIPVTELMKMRDKSGKRPAIGTTYNQAAQQGITLEANISGDAASKLAMLDTAKQGLEDIKGIQFGKDGAINADAIKQAWGIGVAEPLAGLMAPESGKLFTAYEFGIQAITRAETGAAMPSEEIDNTRKRFMPKPWDSDAVVKQKWKAYNLFINNASKYVNPAAAQKGDWKGTIDFTTLMNDAKADEVINFEDM